MNSTPPPNPWIALLIGVMMPMFSVAFTYVAGTFWLKGATIAAVTLAVGGISGLIVSLMHIAEAIHYATGTNKALSMLLGAGFEVGIVGLEIGYVTQHDALAEWMRLVMMVTLAVVVALPNVYAFHLYRWIQERSLELSPMAGGKAR